MLEMITVLPSADALSVVFNLINKNIKMVGKGDLTDPATRISDPYPQYSISARSRRLRASPLNQQ